MRRALRDLSANSWVIGIATAIALGYAVVRVAASIAGIVLDLAEGERTRGTFTAYGVSYRGLLGTGMTLLIVLVVAALALRRSEEQG
jgi:hypothetical protein